MDIHSVLQNHLVKQTVENSFPEEKKDSLVSESLIPDVFFDDILSQYKLNRMEIMLMMFLYRKTWCGEQPYQKYGVSPAITHTEMAKIQGLEREDVYRVMRKLEFLALIEPVRNGQYFVRRYFTENLDEKYGQIYKQF